jgi:hypothetical protein
MSWAARRRLVILFILALIGAAFLLVLGIATFYKTPSCMDRTQNQGEAGIDCGGPCPYLCTADEVAPTVLYTKAIDSGNGRTDVIASIENVNANAAAKKVPYTVALYGQHQVLLKEVTGTVDLTPTGTVPVFIPGIASGSEKITNAFLSIDNSQIHWFRFSDASLQSPVVRNTVIGGTAEAPRITATLSNNNLSALETVRVVAVVHNAQKEVIAASSTLVPAIPPQGEASATFTWNTPFPAIPATIEILPITALP